MDKKLVIYQDLGRIGYKSAWEYQENLLRENVRIKSILAGRENIFNDAAVALQQEYSFSQTPTTVPDTANYFLLCEHPPVYTLGKGGKMENMLISAEAMDEKGIEFYRTNRGGDITFHGPEQIVGYPILDLEKLYTDIGRYMNELEEVIILTLAEYGIKGERSKGETGVWLEPGKTGRERKICAMGVRCSRWITMHGFALNVNTDLSYFEHIIPCGIINKRVTSIKNELGKEADLQEVKEKLQRNFENVFDVKLVY